MRDDRCGIADMTPAFAREIAAWRYAGEYAVYDLEENEDTLAELLGGDYVACVDGDGRLVGYFCFGQSARIPTKESGRYPEGYADLGLGMRPSLCGEGRGRGFLTCGLRYLRRLRPGVPPRLSVARFNRRAAALYGNMGFVVQDTATHGVSGELFDIMTLPPDACPP